MTIVALGAAAALATACGKKEAAAPPPPEVKVATVLQQDVPVYVEAIGQTRGSTEIEVRARVEGFLETVDFKEGTLVRKGQLLYTIDPRPFEASAGPGQGQPGRGRGAARAGHAGRGALRAAGGQERDLARRSTRRRSRSSRRRRPRVEAAKAVGRQRARSTSATPRSWRPTTGMVGQDRGLPRHARGPRAEHAAHAHLADRHRSTCASASPSGTTSTTRAGAQAAAARRSDRDAALRAGPRRRLRASRSKGTLVFVDRNVDAADRHDPGRGRVPEPGRDRAVRASTRACARRSTQKQGAILVPQRAVQEMQGIYNVAVVKPRRHGRACAW